MGTGWPRDQSPCRPQATSPPAEWPQETQGIGLACIAQKA